MTENINSDTEFAICPYCSCWNEPKRMDIISGMINCFYCKNTFNYKIGLNEQEAEQYL